MFLSHRAAQEKRRFFKEKTLITEFVLAQGSQILLHKLPQE
jgi:hypothetical protein